MKNDNAQSPQKVPLRFRVALACFLGTKIAAGIGILLWLAISVSACHRAGQPPPKVVANLDLNRYQGVWYEFASIPNPFQKGCHDTRATYRISSANDVSVENSCRRNSSDAPRSSAQGRAWVVDPKIPAKLRVRFFWPFSGDYWVLGIAPDYSWAVVGQPSRKYGWILSRAPRLSEAGIQAAKRIVVQSGYSFERFRLTPQSASD